MSRTLYDLIGLAAGVAPDGSGGGGGDKRDGKGGTKAVKS